LKEIKSAFYLLLSLGMLAYAVPRLEVGRGLEPATLFGAAWISMALLLIAAHLRIVLRVDEASYGREQAPGQAPARARK
jgi:hypothetical protein